MNVSLKDKIKESLGISNKERTEPLHDDTREVVEEPSVEEEINALEAEIEKDIAEADPAEAARIQLASFELSAGAHSLLDRAMDSLSKNTGAGLQDPDAIADAKARAAVIRASGNDLNTAVSAYIQVTPVSEIGGVIYSLLYSVLKQAMFFANLDYRQALGMDAYSDESVVCEWFVRYVDTRYEQEALAKVVEGVVIDPDSNRDYAGEFGFETYREAQLSALHTVYGSADVEDAVVTAVSDLRLFFQLMAESMGWEPDREMPYGNVMKPDGTFEPIHGVINALDAIEIKRQAAQIRRREERLARASAATLAAQAIVAKALERKPLRAR